MWNRKRTAAFALIALAAWGCTPDEYPTESRFDPPPEEVELPDGELFFYTPPAGVTVTSVAVPGSFNGWDPTNAEAQMFELPDGRWVVGLDLAEGDYEYKYHFNGTTWAGNMCNDPTWGNPDFGGKVDSALVTCNGENGTRHVGDPAPTGHTFLYLVPAGVDVEVVTAAGTFQPAGAQWNNTSDTLSNVWTLTVDLPEGTHNYKYVFNDGGWVGSMCADPRGNPVGGRVDPDNDEPCTGGGDGTLTIDEAGPHTFRYIVPAGADSIAAIHVAGSFQGWNPASAEHSMQETFQRHYDLAAGDYEYKFIFDGNWAGNMCEDTTYGDPDNSFIVDANGGTCADGGNATLTVE